MGWFNKGGGKEGTFIEGRESKTHTHKDGSKGTDTYAAEVVYRDNSVVNEKDSGFGHISNGSSTPDHVK